MTVTVTPENKASSHHISLTDGVTTIGLKLCDGRGNILENLTKSGFPRTALRTSTGATGYGDFEPPFTPLAQTDWSGGRGAENLDDDSSRYWDSESVDTTHGDIILAGLPTVGTGYSITASTSGTEGDADYTLGQGATELTASAYTPGGNKAVRRVIVPLKRYGTTVNPVIFRVLIYSDSSGPNTILAESSYKSVELSATEIAYVAFDLAYTLTSGTKYWIAIETQANKLAYTRKDSTETGNAIMRKVLAGWTTQLSNQSIAFQIVTGSAGAGTAHFFSYRGQLYAATAPDDGGAPAIFMNGWRGVAASNSTDLSKLNTALNLSGVDLTGCVAKIVKGPGSTEYQNWRVITANTQTGTNDSITINPKWNVAHTTDTEYVILGADTWQDVASMVGGASYSALKYPVTSVRVVEDQIYIAQGLDAADAYVLELCQDNNSGTFRTRIAAVPGNILARFVSTNILSTGVKKVYLSTSNFEIKTATAVAYGVEPTLSAAIAIGSADGRITGMRSYGDPAMMWVFKEDQFGSISNDDKYARVPLDEYGAGASERNGRALATSGVYLYLSYLNGLERYYDSSLDDIGPNRDEGFPDGRSGAITDIIGYPGRLYAAVDAGEDGYSSVVCFNGTGWHEVYRSTQGARIRKLAIQVMPHLDYNKLWMSVDEVLVWIPVAINARKAQGYPYAASGTLTSAWVYGSLKDVNKYFHALTLFTENLSSGRSISLEYQTDTETTWHNAEDVFDTSPVQEVVLSEDNDTVGRRLRYRLTLSSDSTTVSPRVTAAVLNTVMRLPTKFMWNCSFLASDYSRDLGGVVMDFADAKTLIDQLDTWANSSDQAAPLMVRSNLNEIDSFYAFIEPTSIRLNRVEEDGPNRKATYIGQMTLIGM